jgi:hypothetical protein
MRCLSTPGCWLLVPPGLLQCVQALSTIGSDKRDTPRFITRRYVRRCCVGVSTGKESKREFEASERSTQSPPHHRISSSTKALSNPQAQHTTTLSDPRQNTHASKQSVALQIPNRTTMAEPTPNTAPQIAESEPTPITNGTPAVNDVEMADSIPAQEVHVTSSRAAKIYANPYSQYRNLPCKSQLPYPHPPSLHQYHHQRRPPHVTARTQVCPHNQRLHSPYLMAARRVSISTRG